MACLTDLETTGLYISSTIRFSSMNLVFLVFFSLFRLPNLVSIVICSSDVAYNSGINSRNNLIEKLCHPLLNIFE